MTTKNTSTLRLQELMVFHAILSNGSITAAAEALGVSQSSVSKQLKCLRDYFGDELFVRSGRGMAATNKALSVAPQIANLISAFEALSGEIAFDSRDVERDFVISTSDEVQHFLLPRLIARIASESPKSRIIFKALDRNYAAKQLESGSVDVVITPNWHVPEHLKQKRLFSDDFVVIHRKGHPLHGREFTRKEYLAAAHMMVSPLGTVFGPVDELLGADGQRRFVNLVVPYFMQVGDALCGSDLLLTLQRRTCEELLRSNALAISELPLSTPPIHYYLFWHKRYDKDSTNQWLRQLCCDILRD